MIKRPIYCKFQKSKKLFANFSDFLNLFISGNNQKFAELKNENAKLRGIVADLKQWDIKREEELNDCRKKEQNMKFLNRKLTERLILNQKVL